MEVSRAKVSKKKIYWTPGYLISHSANKQSKNFLLLKLVTHRPKQPQQVVSQPLTVQCTTGSCDEYFK